MIRTSPVLTSRFSILLVTMSYYCCASCSDEKSFISVLSNKSEISPQQELREAKIVIKNLTDDLVIAHQERDFFRLEAENSALLMTVFGLDPDHLKDNDFNERLLIAVSDLESMKQSRDDILQRLYQLNVALMNVLPSLKIHPVLHSYIQREISKTSTLFQTISSEKEIQQNSISGKVVAFKPELAVVIADIGSINGVKIGMPFDIFRDNQSLAQVLVVDVRKNVSAAIIKNFNKKQPIQAGDSLVLDTIKE